MENENIDQFGMSSADVANYNRQTFLSKIKNFLSAIEPVVVKILNAIAYYTLRFIKAFVTTVIRMVMGKEV